MFKKIINLGLFTLSFSLIAQNSNSNTLSGVVKIDGSSTVFPITEAMAEEFGKEQKKVRVNVGLSGTGGGFKKFVIGETDINDASRPIKDSEITAAKTNKVEYVELPVAYDGITIVVNKANDWADTITVAELKKIWEPGSKVKKWSDVRPEWPKQDIKLFGPGTDSGTFDYFTEAINGESRASRSDFTQSEDDNVIVTGVQGEKYAMGYFGFAYYEENQNAIKALKVDGGKGAIMPTMVTINDGTYAPLSRPIYIYVSKASLKNDHVKEFVKFYMNQALAIVPQVGYVPLKKEKYEENIKSL